MLLRSLFILFMVLNVQCANVKERFFGVIKGHKIGSKQSFCCRKPFCFEPIALCLAHILSRLGVMSPY